MPAARKISARQLEILISALEENVDVALGQCSRGPQSNQLTHKFWDSVALKLNAVADGVTKTRDQWRRYWIELKAKTKCKAADNRRNARGTGGGPNKLIPLSEYEKRIVQIVGPVAVEGLPGVAIPFQQPSSSSQATSSQEDMEVEWLYFGSSPAPGPSSTTPPLQQTTTSDLPQPSPPPVTPPMVSPQPQTPLIVSSPPPTPQMVASQSEVLESSQPELLVVGASATPPRQPPRPRRRRTIQDPDVPTWVMDFERRRLDEEQERNRATEVFRGQLLQQFGILNRRLDQIQTALNKFPNNS